MSRKPKPKRGEGEARKPGAFTRFLNFVEWLGNLLPHPVTLFFLLCVLILIVSAIAGALGWAVPDPRPEGAAGRAEDGMIRAVSLLNGDGLRQIVENMVTNFTGFVPLGTVLVSLLGVGVAERSGLLAAGIRLLVLRAPKHLVTVAVVFASVISNTASEMGYVVLIPLAGVVFYALGRHPLAGIAAAFAGVSGGYSANLFIGTVDPLLAGITQEAARLIDPEIIVHPLSNWWFLIVSTFVVTGVGTWVTAKIVEPKLGTYDPSNAEKDVLSSMKVEPLSAGEKRGLAWAAFSALVVGGLIALTVIPEWGMLRSPDDGSILNSPFLRGVVTIILVFFIVPGIVYGKVTKEFKSDVDVIDAMAGAMSSMGLYIVLVFFAAQFVAYFNWSNLGSLTAVVGADGLQSIGLTGPLVFLPFILICGFVNLMLGSASAQWAVTAPIFVPMLMLTGYSPEVIQAAYRIGDSTTNIITPMMSYFGLILAFATRFDKKLGIGTLIATMIPYTIYFMIFWIATFYVWVFFLGMPVGPATEIYYTPPGG